MAAQISQVRKPGSAGGSTAGTILGKVAGAGLGFLIGGPGGALTGASVGGEIGGIGGGASDPGRAAAQSNPVATPEGAIQRRLATQGDDTLTTLRQSALALPELPEELRQQVAPTIMQAYAMAHQQRNSGGGNS